MKNDESHRWGNQVLKPDERKKLLRDRGSLHMETNLRCMQKKWYETRGEILKPNE